MSRWREQQERAIERVLRALNAAVEGASYSIVARPDEQNRRGKDVDAYAESLREPPLAVEHTRLETFADQARDDAWFMQGLGELEGAAAPCLLRVYSPHVNVARGQHWKAIAAAIRHDLAANADHLPEGPAWREIPGVPFRVLVDKQSDGPPGIRLGRMEPGGNRAEQLLATMDRALDHKAEALARYREDGAVGVLVLESNDVALTNEIEMYRALTQATRQRARPWLDQIWLIRTGIARQPYCLHGPEGLMSVVNPPNLRFGRPRGSRTAGGGELAAVGSHRAGDAASSDEE